MARSLKFLGKGAGFGASFRPAMGSPYVWPTIQTYFKDDPLVYQQIKLYKRSSPGLHDLYQSCSKYDRYYKRSPIDCKTLDSIYERAQRAFAPSTQLPLRHINDMNERDYPMNTSPCLPYVRDGFRRKSDCYQIAKTDARHQAHLIKEGHSVKLTPSMVFAKGKICTRDVTKSRAIWGKSFSILIMQGVFFLNLWAFYLIGTTPMAYAYKPFHGGFRKLSNDLFYNGYHLGRDYLMGLDFSAYDTSIPPWLLYKVYSMMSSYLNFGKYQFHGTPNERKTSKLFWRLAKESINTPFTMPDGYTFQKRGGVDSGSLDFQLIECICTWIMVMFACEHLGYNVKFLTVLGDDSLCVINGNTPPDLDLIAATIQDVFGVTVNSDKSYITRDLKQAKFLGRFIRDSAPVKETADTVLAALYPNRSDLSVLDAAERIIALYYDSAGTNPASARFLRTCFDLIQPELETLGYTTNSYPWESRWTKKFQMWGIPPPRYLRLPSPEEMFLLVECSQPHTIYAA